MLLVWLLKGNFSSVLFEIGVIIFQISISMLVGLLPRPSVLRDMMGGIVGFELIDLQSGSFDDAVVYIDVVEIMTASSSISISGLNNSLVGKTANGECFCKF
jgi:hypothetical protein